MNRYIIGSLWDRSNRNGANANFEYLFEGSKRVDELNQRADSILNKSNSTLNEAQKTNDMNEDVQKQLDAIILENGNSEAEVVQARGGLPLLKDRLDETDSQLAEKVEKSNLPIYLSERGVSHLKTATENTALIKQAITEAEMTGRVIILPFVPSGKWVKINEPIQIAVGGITIQGFGNQSRIQQTVFPNAIFDVIAPNVTIEGFFGSHSTFNASGFRGQFRGHLEKSYAGSVCVYADNVTIRRVKGHNQINVVLVYGYDVANDVRKQISNVVVEDIESSDVDFALLVQDVKDFTFYRIKGSYKMMPGSTTPPHLIYFVDGEFENVNVNGGDCMAVDGKDSNAFQLKGLKDSTVRNLVARGCSSTMNLMHNDGLVIKGVTHVGDKHVNQIFGSIEAQEDNNNVVIEDVVIEMDSTGKPFRFGGLTTNSTLKNAKIKSNHTLYDVANSYDVDIQGTNNLAENIDVENVGTVKWTASVGIWGGTGNEISNPKTKGNIRSVSIRTGSGHTLKDYDPKELLPLNQLSISSSLINPNFFPKESTSMGIGNQDRLIAYDRGDFPANSANGVGITSSSHNWNEISGLFKIDNKAIQSYSGNATLAVIDTGTNNIDLTSGIRPKSQEGLAVRVLDNNNYLFARLNNNFHRIELYKVINGTSTSLTTAEMEIDTGRRYQFRVVAFEDKVEVFVDGLSKINHTLTEPELTDLNSATSHGLRTNTSPSGFYDNIEWRKID